MIMYVITHREQTESEEKTKGTSPRNTNAEGLSPERGSSKEGAIRTERVSAKSGSQGCRGDF